MPVVELKSGDHESNFRFLLGCARNGHFPGFALDGRQERDLLKVAMTIPNKPDVPSKFQADVEKVFAKKQRGYLQTALNLAHRTNQRLAAARQREALLMSVARAQGETA